MTFTTASLNGRAHNGLMDEPNPAGRARRRTFTAGYKARILNEYDKLPEHSGERGSLLRREALHGSHIIEWRKARDRAAEAGLAPKPKTPKRSAADIELERLRSRNKRLEAELAKTKLALAITGKAHALLELISESADSDSKPTK